MGGGSTGLGIIPKKTVFFLLLPLHELFHIYICEEVKMAWLHLKENLKMND